MVSACTHTYETGYYIVTMDTYLRYQSAVVKQRLERSDVASE